MTELQDLMLCAYYCK